MEIIKQNTATRIIQGSLKQTIIWRFYFKLYGDMEF